MELLAELATINKRWLHVQCVFEIFTFELRAVAAFRREAASGNRGPTLKQPRCKLNLRDQRRTHCLSCLAVFQARGAEGVTKPSGAEGVTNSCAATAGVGAMPFVTL